VAISIPKKIIITQKIIGSLFSRLFLTTDSLGPQNEYISNSEIKIIYN
jgi:hypothetical protein